MCAGIIKQLSLSPRAKYLINLNTPKDYCCLVVGIITGSVHVTCVDVHKNMLLTCGHRPPVIISVLETAALSVAEVVSY